MAEGGGPRKPDFRELVTDDTAVGIRYETIELIGKGSFGVVYSAKHVASQRRVAIKLQDIKACGCLTNETRVYDVLGDKIRGIPKTHWTGVLKEHHVLIMDLLGPSLQDLLVYFREEAGAESYPLEVVTNISLQVVTVLEQVHANGILHRDIKPDNLLLGLGAEKSSVVHVADFGLGKCWTDVTKPDGHARNTCPHMNPRKPITGTLRFVSMNVHLGNVCSRRDDLLSYGYSMVYLAKGSLPWCDVPAPTREARHDRIYQIKNSTKLEDLCSGLPIEFKAYISECQKLRYSEEPEYGMLKSLFTRLAQHEDFDLGPLWDKVHIPRPEDLPEDPPEVPVGSSAEDEPDASAKRRRRSVHRYIRLMKVPDPNSPPKRPQPRGPPRPILKKGKSV